MRCSIEEEIMPTKQELVNGSVMTEQLVQADAVLSFGDGVRPEMCSSGHVLV